MWIALIILLLGMLVILALAAIGIHQEKKLWNGGKCSCGRLWVPYETGEHGLRGYSCDACRNYIGISWSVDKRK